MKHITTLLGRTAAFVVAIALAAVLMAAAPATASASSDDASKASSVSKTVDNTAQKATGHVKKNLKCKKSPKPFVKNGVTVIGLKTCFNITILKKMGCNTKAGKVEQPAPPRDPRSECKGGLNVNFELKMKSPKPPPGMMCTEFSMSFKIKQWMKAHGLSVSIANGRVDTWAETHLKLKDVIKGWIKTNCVTIPVIEPPVDVCPEIPGNQPEGTDCTPPHDECPNIPGNQPVGYECYPPVDVCTNIPGNQPPGTVCYAAPQATAPFVNDVLVNNTRTITFTGKLAKGTTGFAAATAGTGTIVGSNRVALTVDGDGYYSVTYTYKAGAEPGTDTVTLVVDQSDGQSVTVKTKGKLPSGQEVEYFQIRGIPPESE